MSYYNGQADVKGAGAQLIGMVVVGLLAVCYAYPGRTLAAVSFLPLAAAFWFANVNYLAIGYMIEIILLFSLLLILALWVGWRGREQT